MALAASSPPRPLSSDDSDSDIEPNSRGARVFWGNLKTPEKSRTVFVDPPQTVLRSTATATTVDRRRSGRLSIVAPHFSEVVNADDNDPFRVLSFASARMRLIEFWSQIQLPVSKLTHY